MIISGQFYTHSANAEVHCFHEDRAFANYDNVKGSITLSKLIFQEDFVLMINVCFEGNVFTETRIGGLLLFLKFNIDKTD